MVVVLVYVVLEFSCCEDDKLESELSLEGYVCVFEFELLPVETGLGVGVGTETGVGSGTGEGGTMGLISYTNVKDA